MLLVGLVAWFISAPLREGGGGVDEAGVDPVLDELEVAKQVKYREIRDAELDHASGKLSKADFARLDAELRRDAIEILRKIDERRAELG